MPKNKPIWITGLMSGTSLDGVDGAQVLTDGVDILEIGESHYRPYTDRERDVLRTGLGKWPGDASLDSVASVVHNAHVEVIKALPQVGLVGFHGQTLAHDPKGRGTHQIGDGAWLANAAGVKVAWDFRSNDVHLGGQGAPLAPIYHWAMARYVNVDEPVAILNLGGVGNITYVDPNQPPESGVLAFDTGPANAPLDDFMMARCGMKYDKDGALAASGQVDKAIIDKFQAHPFFARMPPKSLDRDAFSELGRAITALSDADGAATLTHAMVAAVTHGMQHMPTPPTQLWVSGGGRLNPVVMRSLKAALKCPVTKVEDAGFDGDMVEAQAFAFLAARVANGMPTSFPKTTGVAMAVGGGVMSTPD